MCRIMEEMAKEERLEERLKMAAKILESGKMTEEELSAMFKLTAKQMHAIKEKVVFWLNNYDTYICTGDFYFST